MLGIESFFPIIQAGVQVGSKMELEKLIWGVGDGIRATDSARLSS